MSAVPTIGAWCGSSRSNWVTSRLGLKVIEVTDDPVFTLAALRNQCEITPTEVDSDGVEIHPDDGLLFDIAAAAVDYAEEFTGLVLRFGTYETALNGFPSSGAIEMPTGPLIEILSVTVGDDSDGPLDPASYILDDYHVPALLYSSGSWPVFTPYTNGVRIRFLAGYGSDSGAQPMPAAIKRALLLLIGEWYEHREDAAEIALSLIPNGAKSLLRTKRIRLGMA